MLKRTNVINAWRKGRISSSVPAIYMTRKQVFQNKEITVSLISKIYTYIEINNFKAHV